MTSSVPTGQSGTEDYFDIDKFQQLLDKLEGSKGRQKRQESLEGRRNIFAQGLASMMSNFWFTLLRYKQWPVACLRVKPMLMTGLI